MDQIAQAGGTGQGIFIGNSVGAEQELLDALDAIRGETLSCEILMPSPADAQMEIDPATVNVTFTAGDGTASTFGQVPNMGACASARAWYYDDPQAPTRIALCPAACDTVVADPDARLEILLGCATACGGLDVNCGGEVPPGGQLPPIAPPI